MNLVFTAFFAFEFVVKFAAFGLREYVKDPWNNFDFVIVIGSFLDIIMAQVRMSKMVRTINYYGSDWSRRSLNFHAATLQGDATGGFFLLFLVGSLALVSIKYWLAFLGGLL